MWNPFKKAPAAEQVYRPVAGEVITLDDVPDPVFAGRSIGDGFAVLPTDGVFRAPVDGELALLAETLHAFAVRTGKVAVVYRLNARLADLVTAFIIHSRRRIFQNAVGNRANIAKHLAREGFIRIYAMRALLYIDARERIGVLGNKSNIAASRGR